MRGVLRWLVLALVVGNARAAELVGVTPDELRALMDRGALVVDIRTPEEWKATGVIPGSRRLTFFDPYGQYDKGSWLKQLGPMARFPDQAVILVCRSGNRSTTVGRMLANETGLGRVYHLEKGIRGWLAEDRRLVPR